MLIDILFLYTCIASTFTFSKALLSYFPPSQLLFLRFFCASLILWIIEKISKKNNPIDNSKMNKKDMLTVGKASICIYVIGFIFDNYAMINLSSSFSSLLYNFSPLVAAIISYFAFNKRISLAQLIGLVICFLFGSVLFFNDFFSSEVTVVFEQLIPYTLLLIAIVTSAYGWILMENLVRERKLSVLRVTILGLLGGAIASFGLICYEGISGNYILWHYKANNIVTITGSLYIDLLILIIVSHVVCGWLYGQLLKKYSAVFLSLAGSITPCVSSLFGVYFLKEPISYLFLIALTGICMGTYIFYRDEL